jgi:hypothetical protein
MDYYQILPWIAAVCLIIYIGRQEYNRAAHIYRNKYIINPAEIIPGVSYYSYPVNTICYVCWSGGMRSTALLCYLLVVLGKPVQPIFITKIGPYNNEKIADVIECRRRIIAKYPYLQSRLLPTWYVVSIDKNRAITGKILAIKAPNSTILDAVARFALSCSSDKNNTVGPIMSGGKHSVANLANIVWPLAHMTDDEIKKMALDSKNYFWDCIPTPRRVDGRPCGNL